MQQAGSQAHAADRPVFLVVAPPRAGQVAAHDPLDGQRLAAAAAHRATAQHVLVGGGHFGPGIDVVAQEVVGNHVGEQSKPEHRRRREHLPLAGDALVHHHVERGDAVGGDQQQVVAQRKDLANLARTELAGERQFQG